MEIFIASIIISVAIYFRPFKSTKSTEREDFLNKSIDLFNKNKRAQIIKREDPVDEMLK